MMLTRMNSASGETLLTFFVEYGIKNDDDNDKDENDDVNCICVRPSQRFGRQKHQILKNFASSNGINDNHQQQDPPFNSCCVGDDEDDYYRQGSSFKSCLSSRTLTTTGRQQ